MEHVDRLFYGQDAFWIIEAVLVCPQTEVGFCGDILLCGKLPFYIRRRKTIAGTQELSGSGRSLD